MRIDSNSRIGGVLREARIAADMSSSELAEMIGLEVWALSKVEHDKQSFDTDWIPKMPASLRVAVRNALDRKVKSIQVFQRRGDKPQRTA